MSKKLVELIIDQFAETGEDYEVYFTSDTIQKAEELYMKNLKGNNATYEHQVDIQGLSVIESWISEDEKKDKSSLYGFKMPVGTWFVKMKVENQEVWEKVKSNEVRGFSIEGYFVDKIEEMNKATIPVSNDCTSCPDAYTMKKIGELLLTEFSTPEEAELYATTVKGCEGYHKHTLNGQKVFMPCYDHSSATIVEEEIDELGNVKKKRKKKYKTLQHISYINRKAMEKYDWNECIRDMKKKFGATQIGKEGLCKDKRLAECICATIKNR